MTEIKADAMTDADHECIDKIYCSGAWTKVENAIIDVLAEFLDDPCCRKVLPHILRVEAGLVEEPEPESKYDPDEISAAVARWRGRA